MAIRVAPTPTPMSSPRLRQSDLPRIVDFPPDTLNVRLASFNDPTLFLLKGAPPGVLDAPASIGLSDAAKAAGRCTLLCTASDPDGVLLSSSAIRQCGTQMGVKSRRSVSVSLGRCGEMWDKGLRESHCENKTPSRERRRSGPPR